jgi:hypothetical protein
MAAIVVVGIGIGLFTKVQRMSGRDSANNSRILIAGKMIEKHLEDTRIYIAQDTLHHWPPKNKTLPPVAPDYITLVSRVGPAYSPKDGALVENVVLMEITTSWVYPTRDSLKVTTYVAKRF